MEAGDDTTTASIPFTLQDSLLARLDRLSSAKDVAQRAAVLGRECSYTLLAATSGLDHGTLRQGLALLVESELLFERGAPPSGIAGAGLGLAIARGITAAHGGSIDVAERDGGGATLRVTLPVVDEPPNERGAP